jgi:preprotein translocase subunit SecE
MAKAIAAASGNDEQRNKLVVGVTGWWERTVTFLTDVRNEMRKVHSPGRQEVQVTTFVVILTVFAFGAYFYAVDSLFGAVLDRMLHKLAGR